jgi:hypothetical protein
MLAAMTTIFFQLQPILEDLFIFIGKIIDPFASGTLHLDFIISFF